MLTHKERHLCPAHYNANILRSIGAQEESADRAEVQIEGGMPGAIIQLTLACSMEVKLVGRRGIGPKRAKAAREAYERLSPEEKAARDRVANALLLIIPAIILLALLAAWLVSK